MFVLFHGFVGGWIGVGYCCTFFCDLCFWMEGGEAMSEYGFIGFGFLDLWM